MLCSNLTNPRHDRLSAVLSLFTREICGNRIMRVRQRVETRMDLSVGDAVLG